MGITLPGIIITMVTTTEIPHISGTCMITGKFLQFYRGYLVVLFTGKIIPQVFTDLLVKNAGAPPIMSFDHS